MLQSAPPKPLANVILLGYGPAKFASNPEKQMAQQSIPHFHNSDGVSKIEISAREFQCIGALPPFDHPHVFLDMGNDNEIVCPYCSTHYVYNSKLTVGLSDPIGAVYTPEVA